MNSIHQNVNYVYQHFVSFNFSGAQADDLDSTAGWADKETSEDNGYITSLEVEEMEEGGTKWIGKITAWYGQFLFLYP